MLKHIFLHRLTVFDTLTELHITSYLLKEESPWKEWKKEKANIGFEDVSKPMSL